MPGPVSIQTFRDAAEVYLDDDSVRLNRKEDDELVPFGSKTFFSVSFFTSSTAKENMAVRWQFLNALAKANDIKDGNRILEMARELHIDNPDDAINGGSKPLSIRTVRAMLAKYDNNKEISELKKANDDFQEHFVNFPPNSTGAKIAASVQAQVDKMLQKIRNFSSGIDTYEGINLKYNDLKDQLTALKTFVTGIDTAIRYALHNEIDSTANSKFLLKDTDFSIKSAESWSKAIQRGMDKIFDAKSGNFDADLLEHFSRTISIAYKRTYVPQLNMVLYPEVAADLEKKCMDFLDSLFTDGNARITDKMLDDIDIKSKAAIRKNTDVILKAMEKLPSPAALKKSYPHISEINMSAYKTSWDKLKLKSENIYLALSSFSDLKNAIFDCEFVKYCKKKPWYQNCINQLKKEVMDLMGDNIKIDTKQLEEGIMGMVDQKIQSQYPSHYVKHMLIDSNSPLTREKMADDIQGIFTTGITDDNKSHFMDMFPLTRMQAADESGKSQLNFSDFGELLFRVSLGSAAKGKPSEGPEKSNAENPQSSLQPYVDSELHDGVLKDLKKIVPQLQSLAKEEVIQPDDMDASLHVIFKQDSKNKLAKGDLALFSRHADFCDPLLDALSQQDGSFDMKGALAVIQKFFVNYKTTKADIFRQGEETVQQMRKELSPTDMNDKTKMQKLESDIKNFERDLQSTFNAKFMNLTMFCIRQREKKAKQPVSDVTNQSLIDNFRKIYARLMTYTSELLNKTSMEGQENPNFEELNNKRTRIEDFYRSLKTTAIGLSFEIELNDIAVNSSEKKAIDKWIETAFNE